MSIVLLSLALAASTTTDQSYTKSTLVDKKYDNNKKFPYTEQIVVCKSGSKTFNKTVDYTQGGFGNWNYYANEVPFYKDKSGQVWQKTGIWFYTFDDAAKKACFG